MSFDWQTEETVEWDEIVDAKEPQEPRPPRRWPIVILILFVFAGGIGFVGYRELFRRVDVGTSNTEADLLASYEVVQTAVSAQDSDLLTNFLSGADMDWVRTVDVLVENGRYYDRAPFYMQWLPPQSILSPTITLSPDLAEAELVTEQEYAIDIGNGLTDTIRLQETAVYRLGPNRWLLSPPKPEFWGEPQTITGEILVLRYLERDADIAQRLALDIDAKLLELCAKFPELNCSDTFQVRLTLTSHAEWLNSSQGVSVFWLPQNNPQQLRLTPMPTPSLIGLPVDEVGYQALYRGYASIIVTAVVADRLEADCCFDSVLYRAALADMMAQISLQPWPLAEVDYQQFLLNPLGWYELNEVWGKKRPFPTPEQDWAAYALFDYVVNELGLLTTVEFQKSLVEFTEQPYAEWIQHILAPLQSNLLLDNAWLNFLYDQSGIAQSTPPFPLPNQNLHLICKDDQTSWSLVQYDLETNQFGYVSRSIAGPAFLRGLPDDHGVIVGDRLDSDLQADLFIWQNGQKVEISWPRTPETPGSFPMAFDPTGTRLLISGSERAITPFGMLPVSACFTGDACNLEVLTGFPVWSPNGMESLVSENYQHLDDIRKGSVLHLGNQDGVVAESSVDGLVGAAPFWLNDHQFGFVHFDEMLEETAVYTASVNEGMPSLLFTSEVLMQALPEDTLPGALEIDAVLPNPNRDEQLFVVTNQLLAEQSAAHLFVYSMDDGTVQYRLSLEDESRNGRRGYGWSPNGRFLTLTSFSEKAAQWLLYVHDLQTKSTLVLPMGQHDSLPAHHFVDWSANGNWLTLNQDGYMRIIHPASGYERWAVSPVLDCSSAAWVQNESP